MPFHRVMDGFMAQTGDGQNFNGTGGSKYPNLKAEFSNVPFKRGIVGMARRGDSVDSANSQFFIMFADGSSLNGKYTVIGEVVSGMDVVDKLKKAPADRRRRGDRSRQDGEGAGRIRHQVRRWRRRRSTLDLVRSGAAVAVIDRVGAGRAGAGRQHQAMSFARLRTCWKPPPASRANPGIDITVIVSFNRDGRHLRPSENHL